jgi:hypothetical protein
VGVGTYTSSGNTLSRDTVLASSNSNSLVTFTSGTKDVFVSAPAERFGPNWQSVQTGNFTASPNCAYPINTTSGAITVILPASPKVNDVVAFVDYAGTFSTNALTLNPNGNKINASTSNQQVIVNRSFLNLLYVNSTQGWITISNTITASPYGIEYLIVAGGAGGGGGHGGGGGAGGYLTNSGSSLTVSPLNSYSIVIGSAGAGGIYNAALATNGGNTTAFGLTAIGGGRGGCQNATGGPYPDGASGGSGGGGSTTTTGTTGNGGSGTSGQGYAGGNSPYWSGVDWPGGGGGGAGGVGQASTSATTGGNGGTGRNTESTWATATLTGVSGYYASGGAGNKGTATNGGGNGAPAYGGGDIAGVGTINTGSGGGGGRAVAGGNGGSGIVIIKYSGTQKGSGGTVVTTGGYTYHTFTSSGTYIA